MRAHGHPKRKALRPRASKSRRATPRLTVDVQEAALALFAGSKMVYDEPVTLGERGNAQHQMIERIQYAEHSLTFFRDWEGHPHGPRYKHFFFEQPGKPRRELKFLN